MHIRFTLKELLAANQMDSHGVLGDIAKSTNLHRHTIERLYGNRTRTVSLDVLELLCDALLAKNIPAGELPGGLFGRSALWEQIARFAKSVTFYLAERVITESSQNPAALTLSSDDVDVLTTLFTNSRVGGLPQRSAPARCHSTSKMSATHVATTTFRTPEACSAKFERLTMDGHTS